MICIAYLLSVKNRDINLVWLLVSKNRVCQKVRLSKHALRFFLIHKCLMTFPFAYVIKAGRALNKESNFIHS